MPGYKVQKALKRRRGSPLHLTTRVTLILWLLHVQGIETNPRGKTAIVFIDSGCFSEKE